jgi:hypothetical protein
MPGSVKRRNRYVYPQSFAASLPLFNLPEIFTRLDVKFNPGAFIYPGES